MIVQPGARPSVDSSSISNFSPAISSGLKPNSDNPTDFDLALPVEFFVSCGAFAITTGCGFNSRTATRVTINRNR